MKAIETAWRGFRFRSRLEARWAVFFDSMGIEAWYEPEGFFFYDGTMYLPDFYLPHVQYYAEVKPDFPTCQEMHKAESLTDGTGKKFLFLIGPPSYRDYPCVWSSTTKDHASIPGAVSLDIHDRPKYYQDEHRLFTDPVRSSWPPSAEEFSARYRQAVEASRAERFGESR